MSRRFWAGVMFLSIGLAAGSAYVMNQRLSIPEPQPAVLREVPASEAPAMPVVDTSTATALSDSATAQAPVVAAESADPTPAPRTDGQRNILFKLVRPNAKEVALIGDFNNWMRKPMTKKGKFWELSVTLKPGKYEYAFVVDGKRVRDPNNKQTGSNGRASLLTVKPLASRP